MGAYEVEETQVEQGWDFGDGYVCAQCVDDEALARKITVDAVTDGACDYCTGRPAAPLDTLLAAFFDGLHTEYGLAGGELAYFGGELVPSESWDGDELVDEYADVLVPGALQEAVRQAARADDVWVRRHFIEPRRDQALLDGWERFSEQVKYRTRHVFWLAPPHEKEAYLGGGEIPAADVLQALGDLIPDAGLVRELDPGQRLWRARAHQADEHPLSARELGTALPEQARRPNRMSPAGIPLFYGADSRQTAIDEVARHVAGRGWRVTSAAFEITRPCTVIDFTRLAPVPTIFDTGRSHVRHALNFLHQFTERISADTDGHEHLAYVPTQIVTEYLLKVFSAQRPVDGLVFTSSAAIDSGVCTVLDIPQGRCFDLTGPEPDGHPALRMVPSTLLSDQPLL
ncbi:HEPN-associated N-terminal domain-containing protein [Streptomyces sp. NPDC056486]|uniref:HEPN-associated N-terminal domain-containing protein n=1 Tax=Streptomyces sp. NPDC056486 TaxID=3345835 RepID=UPI00368A8B83